MIKKGDKIILWNQDSMKLVDVDGETKKIGSIGVVDTDRFIENNYGSKVEFGNRRFYLLQPALSDTPEIFKREAQIVLPHIGTQIVHACDLHSGSCVIEGGAGSGVLSSVLTHAVMKEGEVTTYEIREDFLQIAKKNMRTIEMDGYWVPKKGDVKEDVDERNVDAFILDIPDPWEAVDMADGCLKNGGHFCSYVPTTNQLEKIVKEMRGRDYIDIDSFEILKRDMVVGEGGVRPSYDMLGHTGYIAVGRKTP